MKREDSGKTIYWKKAKLLDDGFKALVRMSGPLFQESPLVCGSLASIAEKVCEE